MSAEVQAIRSQAEQKEAQPFFVVSALLLSLFPSLTQYLPLSLSLSGMWLSHLGLISFGTDGLNTMFATDWGSFCWEEGRGGH